MECFTELSVKDGVILREEKTANPSNIRADRLEAANLKTPREGEHDPPPETAHLGGRGPTGTPRGLRELPAISPICSLDSKRTPPMQI